MTMSFINKTNVRDIAPEILDTDGKLKLLTAAEYDNYSYEERRLFCHFYGRYCLPTKELIDYLKNELEGTVIEIGAGHGDIAKHLGIHATDKKIQEIPEVKATYDLMRQPVINYPDDIEKLDAIEAVAKYEPRVVIAAWVTTYAPKPTYFQSSPYGVNEQELLKWIKKFILIGTDSIHGDKPICALPHRREFMPWLQSRAKEQQDNCIFTWWNNENNII